MAFGRDAMDKNEWEVKCQTKAQVMMLHRGQTLVKVTRNLKGLPAYDEGINVEHVRSVLDQKALEDAA
jgi:hypothetical protein